MQSVTLSVLTILMVSFPSSALGALQQPAGQVPVNEPLKTMDPGTKPNYDKSIQDNRTLENKPEQSQSQQPEEGVTNDQEVLEPDAGHQVNTDHQSVDSPHNATVSTSVSSYGMVNRIWVVIALFLIIIIVGIFAYIFMRMKKHSSGDENSSPESIKDLINKDLVLLLVSGLVGISVVLGGLAGFHHKMIAHAQTFTPSQPIQRTIVVEGEENSVLSSPEQNGHTTNTKRVFYAVLVVVLISVAGIAGYFVWKPNKDIK